MKNLMKFLAIVLIVVATSCKKDTPIEFPDVPNISIKNPFSQAGLAHNQILDDIIALPNPAGMSREDLKAFIIEKGDSIYGGPAFQEIQMDASFVDSFRVKPYETLLENNMITQNEYNFLIKMEAALCCPETMEDELLKLIKEIMDPINSPFIPLPSLNNNNSGTELVEGTKVLLVLSVAIKSNQYWTSQKASDISKWKDIPNASQQLLGGLRKIVRADVIGALHGIGMAKRAGVSTWKAAVIQGAENSARQAIDNLSDLIWGD